MRHIPEYSNDTLQSAFHALNKRMSPQENRKKDTLDVHVVISILGISGTSKFHKSITEDRVGEVR